MSRFGGTLGRLKAQFDWPLALAMLVIATIGLINLWSATRVAPKGMYQHQMAWFAIGFVLFTVSAAIDYRKLEQYSYALYLGGLILLVAVLIGGKSVNGSRRWLGVGSLGIQPSELIKIGVILALARLFSGDSMDLGLRPWRYVQTALGLGALAAVLVAKQPDLGTAMIIILVMISMIWVSPFATLEKLVVSAQVGIAGMALIFFKMHGYQKKRLLTFFDPSFDPSGAGWHARQALFAVGSGRWAGKGWLHGTQNQLQFLPEHWTDFPFAVWAEEWGFFGCTILIAAYLFLLLWAINLAQKARDRFAQMVCLGACALLFWHTFFNIGMVVGLLPVVGVTLPLVSYGGSSLLTTMIALGLIMNVSIRRYAY